MKKLLTLVLALAMTLSLAAVERTRPMKAARAALPASPPR